MRRSIAITGVVGLTGSALVLAYWLCFALWMTAYYRGSPALLRSWQVGFWLLALSLLLVCASNLYLIIKLIRTRKHQDV